MKSKALFLLLSIIMMGCQFNSQQSEIGDLPVIDLSKSYPEKKISLRNIADIEYVPLEITNDVLLGPNSILTYVSDKYIVVFDLLQDEIFVFNRKGKIVSHFSRKGQSGQEYTGISGIVFDEKNEEIFVSDVSTYRFLVYSINGEYKRTLHYSKKLMFIYAYNFDDETMLIYNNDRGVINENYSETPFVLISKKDGSIVSNIDIRLPVRYPNRALEAIDMGGQKGTTAVNIYTPYNIYGCKDYILSDISSDTIYRLAKNRVVTPMLVRTPSVHSSTPPTVWSTLLTTDKFIVLYKTVLDFTAKKKEENTSETLMYEFETGQTSKVTFLNEGWEWFPPVVVIGVDVRENMFAGMLSSIVLKKYYKKLQMRGELDENVKMPDEDDNPAVMIVKFK